MSNVQELNYTVLPCYKVNNVLELYHTQYLLTLRGIEWRLETWGHKTVVRVFSRRIQNTTQRLQPIQSKKIHFLATSTNEFPANLSARQRRVRHVCPTSWHVQRAEYNICEVWTIAEACRDVINNGRVRIGVMLRREAYNGGIEAFFHAGWELFRVYIATLGLLRFGQFCDR